MTGCGGTGAGSVTGRAGLSLHPFPHAPQSRPQSTFRGGRRFGSGSPVAGATSLQPVLCVSLLLAGALTTPVLFFSEVTRYSETGGLLPLGRQGPRQTRSKESHVTSHSSVG